MRFVKIQLHGGSGYIHPIEKLQEAIEEELVDLEDVGKITLSFKPAYITDEEYENLPEFVGH